MAFYFARIWLTDSAAKLVLIAAVLVAKISAANITLAVTGDSVCIPFVIVPALCISFINIIRNYVNSLEINKDDIKISIIALLSIVAGKLFEKLYFVLGNANKNAYLGTKKFIALEDIYTKLALYLQSMLKLFNADFTGAEILSPKVVCCFLGTIIVTISLYSVIWNIWNYLKGRKYDRIALTLSLGFVLISLFCIITNIYINLCYTRYYATAPGILCVVLVRTYAVNIKSYLSDMKSRKMTIILSLFLLIFSCNQLLPLSKSYNILDPQKNILNISIIEEPTLESLSSLINELKANNLNQGYSEFWTASSATVYSQNSIKIRALIKENNKLTQFKWFCKNHWFNEESHFVVVNKNDKGKFFTKSDVENYLGKPDKILLSDPYLIYVYDNNISGLYPLYHLGTEIVASNTDKNNVFKFVKYGLSNPEKEFAWTNGSEMAIGLLLNSNTERIHGQIDITGVYTGKQRVIIYVNNVNVFDSIVASNQKRIDFYFDNPGYKKALDIVLKFPESDSPFNRGESKDNRLLSLAIKRMKFDKCD